MLWTWISLDIAHFHEEHCQPSSGSAWPACPKTIIRPQLLGAGGTMIKFIANYIKGCKAYTTYRNHTSRRQFKTCIPQGGVLSPTLFNIYTSDLPPPSARVQPRNIYNHAYIKFLPGHTAHTFTASQYTHTNLYRS